MKGTIRMKKTIASAAVALLIGGTLALTTALPTSATEECVPKEAWTEVVPDIEHPAVYETVVVTPAVEASTKWWNFSPNDTQAPLEGEPAFPEDERGTWQGPHTEGGPGQDQEGVYQQGEGHGSWFYRENTPAQEEVTEQRLVTEAYTEVVPDIEHPAVVCEEEPPVIEPACTSVTGEATVVWPGSTPGQFNVPGGWATESLNNFPDPGTLADIGTVLDIDADPIQYVGIHIHTEAGKIVFEEEPSYGGKLWSTTEFDGIPAGMGYAAFASIEDFIALHGDLDVTRVSLLYTHPEASSSVVSSVTFGCTVYTFVGVTPEPEPTPEPTLEPTTPVTPAAPQPGAPVPAELAATGAEDIPLWMPMAGAFALLAGLALTGHQIAAARRR